MVLCSASCSTPGAVQSWPVSISAQAERRAVSVRTRANHPGEPEQASRAPHASRRALLSSGLLGLLAAVASPKASQAAESILAHSSAKGSGQSVYWGNGCFWGRQHDFVDLEKSIGRTPEQLSAVVGYAGGTKESDSDGKVCYYHAPRDTVYEGLGHAEVVQVELRADGEQEDFARFAELYFKSFTKTPFGMMRQDPMDTGPGYRNVVGIPGGVRSQLYRILQQKNVHKMDLREGRGNEYVKGRPTEDDRLNVVWVLDSDARPFHLAEDYHQFHNGIGKPFPASYREEQKRVAKLTGRIGPTGCPEYSSFFG